MKAVAIISQKGGVGKTTIAAHLAVAAEQADFTTALFDTDPQASAMKWAYLRKDVPPEAFAAQPPVLREQLAKIAQAGAELAIIDTAPNADVAGSYAAKAADLVLIPCKASYLDLDAIRASVEMAQSSGRPFFILLNDVTVGTTVGTEAAAAIKEAELPLAPIVLHHRMDYVTPLGGGQTALEATPDGKAAGEIAALWAWLAGKLELPKKTEMNAA